jgi:hypothetical protein
MQRDDTPSQVVSRVQKNSREDIVFALGEFMGTRLAHIRIHVPGPDGEDRATAKGVCINIDRLPLVREAVQELERVAIAQGFLPATEGGV